MARVTGKPRVFVCDNCGKHETWRKGWRWYYGVESIANQSPSPTFVMPFSVCSEACEDATFTAWSR